MRDVFFDTNIIVYLTSKDMARSEPVRALIATGGLISVQVLNEFSNVARRKLGFSVSETREFLSNLMVALTVVPVTIEIHKLGLNIAERYQLSIYDSMIVAAAQLAGCTKLYSEDMQHGLVIDGLRVVDPYKD
jgi:predicted nucleic acid-binding protein